MKFRIIMDITATINAKSKKEAIEKLETDVLDEFVVDNIVKIEKEA